MLFIILFGIVSLFSDMTHEGAASIRGAFLSLLGASAATIGFVSGLGELLGDLVATRIQLGLEQASRHLEVDLLDEVFEHLVAGGVDLANDLAPGDGGYIAQQILCGLVGGS